MTLPTIPVYIPLEDAAKKYGYALTELKRLAQSGKINAAVLPDGDMVVSESSVKAKARKEDLPEYKKHAELANETIWVSKAARKYGISQSTISRWTQLGYIKKMGMQGNKSLLNAQDMAYCAEIYDARKGQGKRIFNSDGTPYTPKTGPLSLEAIDTIQEEQSVQEEELEKVEQIEMVVAE